MSQFNMDDDHTVLSHNIRDLIIPVHPELSLNPTVSPSGVTLEDDSDTLSLSSRVHENSSDSDIFAVFQDGNCPEEKKCGVHLSCRGKVPQTHGSECGVCEKDSSSNSSISKHSLTHSEDSSHVCKVCSKAFTCQVHLTGHLLTDLKSKPFACGEQGCSKTDCESCSPRPHCDVQHRMCLRKEANDKDIQRKQDPDALLSQSKTMDSCVSKSTHPNKDLLRSLVTSFVQKNLISNVMASEEQPSHCTSQNSSGRDLLKNCLLFPGKSMSSSPYTGINVAPKDTIGEESPLYPGVDATCLDLWHSKASSSFPVLQSQLIQSKRNIWVRNTAAGSMTAFKEEALRNKPVDISLGALSNLVSSHSLDGSGDNTQWHELGGKWSRQAQHDENSFQHEALFSNFGDPPVESQTDQDPNVQQTFDSITSSQWSMWPNHFKTQSSENILEIPKETLTRPIVEYSDFTSMGDPQKDPVSRPKISDASNEAKETGIYLGLPCTLKSLADSGELVSTGGQNEMAEKTVVPDCEAKYVSETGESQPRNSNNKTQRRLKRPRRTLTTQKNKSKFTVSQGAPPSEVALASFSISSSPSDVGGESNVNVFERLQEDKQCATEGCGRAPETTLHSVDSRGGIPGDRDTEALVMPVSVPVTVTEKHKYKVSEGESQQDLFPPRRGKKRPVPDGLIIPPPVLETHPTPSKCFQSNLRSPNTYLSEHLNDGFFQYLPYTPPPMLSPVRQGTGLYFNTLCSPSGIFLTGEERPDCGICPGKDDKMFTVQPHINIGDRFQAEIPAALDKAVLGREDEKATLVWRPWADTETVSQFLDLACSSAVPGGGTNLELGLHCLHSAQGNIKDGLDKLILTGPQKSLPRSLVDYHYAGSDLWTPSEKRQFKRIYCTHRKNFSLIQSKIPLKNVHQCIEYYYTWKKRVKFERNQTETPGKTDSKTVKDVLTQSGNGKNQVFWEVTGERQPETQTKGKRRRLGKGRDVSPCRQQNAGDRADGPGEFACQQCERVFDTVKSRSSHMRKHRQLSQPDTSPKVSAVPKNTKKKRQGSNDIPFPEKGRSPLTSLDHWLGFTGF